MKQKTYPTITDAMLVPFRAINLQIKDHPDFLESNDCPYSPAVKKFLRRLGDGRSGGDSIEGSVLLDNDNTLQEINDLYTELKRVAFRAGQVAAGDSKDQMAVLKTASDLLSKMVDLKAKAFSVRDMSRFQRAVVEILEGVITPAQRSEFIARMGKYIVQ